MEWTNKFKSRENQWCPHIATIRASHLFHWYTHDKDKQLLDLPEKEYSFLRTKYHRQLFNELRNEGKTFAPRQYGLDDCDLDEALEYLARKLDSFGFSLVGRANSIQDFLKHVVDSANRKDVSRFGILCLLTSQDDFTTTIRSITDLETTCYRKQFIHAAVESFFDKESFHKQLIRFFIPTRTTSLLTERNLSVKILTFARPTTSRIIRTTTLSVFLCFHRIVAIFIS